MAQSEYQRTLQYCQQRYQTILPNDEMRLVSNQIRVQTHFHTSSIVKIISQHELLVQLLIQNALFSKSEIHIKQSMRMLEELEKQWEPKYQLELSQFNEESPLIVDVAPLKNNLQTTLLRCHKQILENQNQKSFEQKVTHLKQYQPLIQLSYIPQLYQSCAKVRCKFTPVDEDLLFQGLQKYGSKNLECISREYLWEKSLKQIKNKYKNSICSNAAMNKIKQWKLNQYEHLTKNEISLLIKGIQWYGKDKAILIQKYYLNTRSVDFINAELNKSESLLKKRKKHNIPEQYPDTYEQIWIQEKKKVQLKSVQKEQVQNFENFLNFFQFNGENSNSMLFRSNLYDMSRFNFTNNQQQQDENKPKLNYQQGFERWNSIIQPQK